MYPKKIFFFNKYKNVKWLLNSIENEFRYNIPTHTEQTILIFQTIIYKTNYANQINLN